MKREAVQDFALSLPGATEEPHFHFTSFRIDGKIFATMPPSNELLHVFVPEAEREASVLAYPDCCEALQWGRRTVGLRIDLERASGRLVKSLLTAAYESKTKSESKSKSRRE